MSQKHKERTMAYLTELEKKMLRIACDFMLSGEHDLSEEQETALERAREKLVSSRLNLSSVSK